MWFVRQSYENPFFYFSWVLLAIFSTCCHEYAHAQVALWQGDSTAADEGHLSLNPMIQMGPISLVMLFVVGICFGSVPVNPARMRHRYSDALVCFAGPLANFILCFIFFVLALIGHFKESDLIMNFFFLGAMFNMAIGIFNLIPVPPFDGWRVFIYFFPKVEQKFHNSEATRGVTAFIFFAAFMSGPYIFSAAHTFLFFLLSVCVRLIQPLLGS